MKNRIARWAVMLLVGLGIGSAIGYFQAQQELNDGVAAMGEQSVATVMKRDTGPIDIDGDFELVNQDGETVTQDTYAGQYKLIFFGFTYCPAICPTELQKMKLIMDELGPMADEFTPIFISVDPERDTPEVIKEYVAQFHPKLIGLTGTLEQIEKVENAYSVYATKVENDMMDEYMMDHSAFMYFMDDENNLIDLYPSTDTVDDIVKSIKEKRGV